MPRGDGSGPMGAGPGSGRGAGFCSGNAAAGFTNFGMRCGNAFRGGRGNRRMQAVNVAPAMTTPETDINWLKNQAAQLANALKDVNDKIAKLESDQEKA